MAIPVSTQQLEGALRRAIDERQLVVHYQPIVDLRTDRMVAVEALVRWRHPTRGLLYPDTFLGLAEETGLVVPLGAWVLSEACGLAAAWERLPPDRSAAEGHDQLETADLVVSVNASRRQLADHTFASQLKHTLDAVGAQPDHLQVEMGEPTDEADAVLATEAAAELHDLGVAVVIDDAHDVPEAKQALERVGADSLKIDGEIVRSLNGDDRGRAEVEDLVHAGHELGMTVVAHGVETDHQLHVVRELGCDQAQGYRLASPVPARMLRPLH
jgi:EAL domain-containing protein (putative c-di-GMP-specific phosphodiesterase class I)